MVSKLTSNGLITVPKEVRKFFNLKAGDRIRFTISNNGKVELLPVKIHLKDLKGILRPPRKRVTLEDMENAIHGSNEEMQIID